MDFKCGIVYCVAQTFPKYLGVPVIRTKCNLYERILTVPPPIVVVYRDTVARLEVEWGQPVVRTMRRVCAPHRAALPPDTTRHLN